MPHKPQAVPPRVPARPLAALVALVLVAWCNPARAGSDCEPRDHATATAPAAAPAVAMPSPPFAPWDPATFVGPPVPVGILFAPAMVPAAAGLRYEIEGAARERTPVAALRPPQGTGLRMVWDPDVQAQLREVPTARGGYMVDLLGAYLDLAILTIGDDGRPVLECAQQPRAPSGTAVRPRAGRE